ncbi:MAG: hypothetical protein GX256_09210, partial [Fretibacterium sp.]|nr:hypothetical protein [Fretibacterium sp.]
PVAALFAALGSVFPDTVEYLIWGSNRARHHRRSSHWFVPWALAFGLAFYLGAEGRIPSLANLLSLPPSRFAAWGCVACWLLGPLLHILTDACCGKIPLLIPWKKTFGIRAFSMSSKRGVMSRGEFVFTAFVALSSLAAWALRVLKV